MKSATALWTLSPIAAIAVLAAGPARAEEPFVASSLYVPSADGTRLAVEVFRPAQAAGPVPVLMIQRNGAERNPNEDEAVRFFTTNGYAVIRQFRRGTGASFGTQRGFVTRDDANDAKSVIDWAGVQPWSSGKVGTFGCSNQGAWQYVTAATKPKHLVAMAPACASPTFFDDTMSRNGVSTFIFEGRPPYNGECGEVPKPGEPVETDKDGALAAAAAREHRCNAAFLGQYQANMHRDTVNTFLGYAPGMVDSVAMQAGEVRKSGVKFLQLAGWFDASPGGQLLGQQLFGGHIVVGPWQHCWARDPGFPESRFEQLKVQLRWFDATLKGANNGMLGEAPVRYYTMNAPAGTEWRTAARWPVPGARPATYHFAAGKTGSVDSLNDGALTAAPQAPGADRYRADHSVQYFDGQYAGLMRYWAGDMRPGVDRKAVTYTMPALARPLEVTGTPVVRLWVRTSAPDADFFAVLEDVAPDGKSTFVSDGAIRASRRKLSRAPWGDTGLPWHSNKAADDQPLQAGVPARLDFAMMPTSWVFRSGHRLRVSIVNAAGKGFQQPPGTDPANPASFEILRGGKYASSVTLPLMPARPIARKMRR